MTQIRINTEQVKAVGRQFDATGERLAEIGYELQRAIGSLDTWTWDGVSRQRAEPLLGQVRPASERVAGELDELGRVLARVAEAFEQEDNTAARNLEGMSWADLIGDAGFDPRIFDLGFLFRFGPIVSIFGLPLTVFGAIFSESFRNWLVTGDWITYKDFEGHLFRGKGPHGIHVDDINQGTLGDCYLMAGMGAIAVTDPQRIYDMIQKNADGTYTVTFHVVEEINGEFIPTGETAQITVDASFPTKDGESFAYGHSNDEKELWPAIVEKAYAKWKGGEGDYEDIEGGFSDKAMAELTGVSSHRVLTQNTTTDELRKDIQNALNSGHPVAAGGGTQSDPDRPFSAQHAYVVESVYQDSNGVWRVDLYNPHGESNTHPNPPLTIDEFQNMLRRVYISDA